MNDLSPTPPARSRQILRAVFIGGAVGLVIGVLIVVALTSPLSDYIEQKYLSLRFRISEILPQPVQPEFAPTPLAMPTEDEGPTTNAPSPSITPTQSVTSVLRPPSSVSPTRPSSPVPRTRIPTLAPDVSPIQASVALRGVKHEYQKWNNCGPTTLAMDLSYFGRTDKQAEIAAFTKPNYDDRNVRPDELAAYANQQGMRSTIRINGTIDQLKLLLSNNVPVIVETALVKQPQGWMGHYRLLVGYDAKQFNTMDLYDGPNVKISFEDLDDAWRAFNRLYLVIYSDKYNALVRAILGDALDDQTMYAQAAAHAREEIAADPKDAFAQFNLGSSLVGLKQYAQAAAAYDRSRTLGLPWRMMWYEFGPYTAYLQTSRNDEVIALADSLLSKTDDLEESHYYKGLALRAQKRETEARREFETALKYNKNYRPQLLCPDCPLP